MDNKIYQKYIDVLEEHASQNNETRFVAHQLLELHKEASSRDKPIIVELGVDQGQSTKVFLNAIDDKKDAVLISVDILDCSNAVQCDSWRFVQSDSADIESIIKLQPIIKNGIDILYVDSLHTASHVSREIYEFFPYVKKNGVIFFDDIESGPYKRGQRKDSVGIEIANRKIFKLLEGIFQSNLSCLDFTIMKGSTGLAKFVKKSNKGEKLKPPAKLKDRNFLFFWKLFYKIIFKKSYFNEKGTNKSFMIDANSDNY